MGALDRSGPAVGHGFQLRPIAGEVQREKGPSVLVVAPGPAANPCTGKLHCHLSPPSSVALARGGLQNRIDKVLGARRMVFLGGLRPVNPGVLSLSLVLLP